MSRPGGWRRVRAWCGAGLMALLTLACPQPISKPSPVGPKLLLLIVVDQFRGDYLERFEGLWSGGLRRLLDEGAVFSDAHHRHAVTHTATGYASLVTGCHPRRHGIISNYWVDPALGQRVYSVADPIHVVSPANLLVPTLGDWLKQRSTLSRVYAISGKDRAAVMMAGAGADAAFWYELGGWTSSAYYPGAEPAWLESFHDRRLADGAFGTAWEFLPVAPEVLAETGVVALDLGPLTLDPPHVFGGLRLAPGERFHLALSGSPWQDGYLTRFAEQLIVEEGLGGDDWTDLLALGYTALDSVGHTYGPDSPEVLDTLLRLDRTLGELLEFVDARIGLDNVIVAFSSDHGVAPLPELGGGGRRMAVADVLCFQSVNRQLGERFGDERWLLPGPFLNPAALTARGVERVAVEDEVVRLLTACPAVERVWRRRELSDPVEPAAVLFANSFHPGRSPDFMVQLEPYFLPTLSAATHGSAYHYDTHVPLIVMAPGVGPLRDGAPAGTIDLAPTLAALAGLEEPAVDGTDLGARLTAGTAP